jgi:hypothetical protein
MLDQIGQVLINLSQLYLSKKPVFEKIVKIFKEGNYQSIKIFVIHLYIN